VNTKQPDHTARAVPHQPRSAWPGLVLLAALAVPAISHAWWNADFKQRTKVTLNTAANGVETREAISGAVVPVRLHSGNFDFVAAKPDGSDLRFVAADDKTPLKFSLERFDGVNELAVAWVQLPTVLPGTDTNVVYAYAGNPKAAAEPPGGAAESGALATFRFGEKDGLSRDLAGALVASVALPQELNGLIGASARLDGTARLDWPASDKIKAAAGAPYSVSLWIKPAGLSGTLFAQGPLQLVLEEGRLVGRLGRAVASGGLLPVSAWAHVGLTVGTGKLTLYLNGTQAAQVDVANAPAIEGPLRAGEGFSGLVDELQLSGVLRSADWMKFTRAVQGADARLVASVKQLEGQGEAAEGDPGYMGILVKNLTVDAWVVIGILGVMFVVAVWVMVVKALLVRRVDGGNSAFVAGFRESADVLKVLGAETYAHSSLARLYDAGVAQLKKRGIGKPDGPVLSGAALDAVKAAVDADLVRENHKLNSAMVWLTIAISGGPFLGLLGTVVGVMITFAAIAAAGDVNVNAIAPGIAAALLATVAGLAVAIPALFGYNYLAARIKNISSDMQIFVDEFVTRVAESYGRDRVER